MNQSCLVDESGGFVAAKLKINSDDFAHHAQVSPGHSNRGVFTGSYAYNRNGTGVAGAPVGYPHRCVIVAGGSRDSAYPYLIQTRDDRIHLIFTSNRRSVINHAVFDEKAIAPNHGFP